MRKPKAYKKNQIAQARANFVFEELEPRVLLSADLPIDLPVAFISHVVPQQVQLLESEAAQFRLVAESPHKELVVVDTGEGRPQLARRHGNVVGPVGLEPHGPTLPRRRATPPRACQHPSMTNHPEELGLSSERLARVDAAMHAYVDKGKLPGVQTMISRRGDLVHHDCYGMANVEA